MIGNIIGQDSGSDTGWVDMTPYLNTEYFSPREDQEGKTAPVARIKNGIVYWEGSIYCIKDFDNIKDTSILAFDNIPQKFIPRTEFGRAGLTYTTGQSYYMFIQPIRNNSIYISQLNPFTEQIYFQGYWLSTISGYPVD